MSNTNLTVSLSPHIRDRSSTRTIMLDVCVALIPAAVMGVVAFGPFAAMLLFISILTAVAAEHIWCAATKTPSSVTDGSALVTGLLVGLNLPSGAPWWIPIAGSAFAIIVVKQFFGGVGHNFVNPALAARAFLLACWPAQMTAFSFADSLMGAPVGVIASAVDAVSSATPLVGLYAHGVAGYGWFFSLFIGNVPGCIGEISKAALLLGGIYLMIRRVIDYKIPLVMLATVFGLSTLFGGPSASLATGLASIMAGGVMLGALFMATDYVTSPITGGGQIIYAAGCGLLVFIIRKYGAYPEGVTYAILFMNVLSPIIDRFVRPRRYGEVASK